MSKQVIGRGRQQAAGIHRLAPGLAADLDDHLPVREDAEIPRAAKTGDEVDLVPPRPKLHGRVDVRIERSVNLEGHEGFPCSDAWVACQGSIVEPDWTKVNAARAARVAWAPVHEGDFPP